MSVSVEIAGLKEVQRDLKRLDKDWLNRKVVQEAASKSLRKTVLKDARALVPKDTTTLRKSLGIRKTKKGRDKNEVGAMVIARHGKKQKYDGWYAHFLVGGTKSRTTANGANRGRISQKPFFAQAQNQSGEKAASLMSSEMEISLNRFKKKYNF